MESSQGNGEIPPQLESEVGLLLGYSCSKALAPKQQGGQNESYAVSTALGWSIVGLTSSHIDYLSLSTVSQSYSQRAPPSDFN